LVSGKVLPGPGAVGQPVILLVEDDILVRLSTAELLRDEGYVVLEAVNAREALALLETGHPLDLIISDIRMPGAMDGLELCSAVKQLRANLPVMLFSSHLPEHVPHCGDAFLAKPYRPRELFELVSKMVGAEWPNQNNNSPTAS
jgi:CheY-like chemotaxis protein